eukprot:COSAG01_NODE_6552_length_3611_cov_3.623292_1_plen_66_part_00
MASAYAVVGRPPPAAALAPLTSAAYGGGRNRCTGRCPMPTPANPGIRLQPPLDRGCIAAKVPLGR